MLSLVGTDLPHPEELRETGSFFQSSKLNETDPLCLRNFSNMSVTELVVFASVKYSLDMAWNVCCLSILKKSIALEQLAPCVEHVCSSS